MALYSAKIESPLILLSQLQKYDLRHIYTAGLRQCHRRPQLTLPLGCEQRELRATASADCSLFQLVQGRVV
jgi:hypothetical protein